MDIDDKKMLAFFRREYERTEDIKFKRRISSTYLTSETKKFAIAGFIILFLFFFGYFTYQLKLFISSPEVEIVHPKTSTFKLEDRVQITAQTEKDATVMIFGERIYQDNNGQFTYNFPLKKGTNELVIEVTGANGKKTILKKEYIKN